MDIHFSIRNTLVCIYYLVFLDSKYYREDGELVLDVGPFSKALEVC